jgi:hypothetical protein
VGRLSQLLSAVSLLLLCSATLQADSFFDKFIDPTDGQFDTSGWLIDNKGFLPVPIIITEPAVGPGLGLAGVFFRKSIKKKGNRRLKEGGRTPGSR